MLLLIARALANSGFAFEGTTVFRWGVATEGIVVCRSTMLPLIAKTFANSVQTLVSCHLGVESDTPLVTIWNILCTALAMAG